MNDATERPPRGIRLLHALQKDPDWPSITAEELAVVSVKANRKAGSRLLRVVTGFPDRGATIAWQEVTLPDRVVGVRVYRPSSGGDAALPLVLHVHGGGFVGTASQCDWGNSHLAARLPAVVVSVEHRLLTEDTALADALDDAWDVLRHLVSHAAEWGIDPARIVVAGESTGGLIAALAAIRAKASGLRLRAQVLVNPAADLTATMHDYPSMAKYADSPTLNTPRLQLFHRLAVPPGTDPRTVSPLYADDLSDLAPALVVVPTLDPLADQGRRYAERLLESGTPARLSEHPGATHAFITMPGLVPQAKAARAEITEFLRNRLTEPQSAQGITTKARVR
ncbi:alpha/beta fold hydrolase [Nocardia sp. SYP-A9097]|uniref:alpha/beta hydrolase n=1 Tax=Nocardia sp. SYP-A9097 TaxID=2663237 RepID=UPI00129BA56E|nr:alpha/beta hydrolase [Nocardia sp. SYP-A9097]MRH86657.1 alpha/beta fold hydrolase [Nocardia sp. SYP-A9097]